ncbi:unnamed protein product [Sphagnum jensenii]|uniref:Sucrose transporter n=1 Tax=Sphagnum jensenii TaxID=128206 RepID=A0ABP0X506_9BRYO
MQREIRDGSRNGEGEFDEEKDDGSDDDGRGGGNLGLRRLALASMVAAGVQFGWALQLSLLTPYVQMLGIEHAFSSFIWLCGPITGLVVQPCIGIWSDKCESRWGRRRPFIFAGVLMISVAVIVIGFAADIGYALGDSHQDCKIFQGVARPRAALVFILGFWLLDLANNTVQGPARALLADLSGPDERDASNAIFCLWMAVGNILGFSTGAYGNWQQWFPALGSKACCDACANIKAAFLLAVVFLALCTCVTLVAARENPLILDRTKASREKQHLKHSNEKKKEHPNPKEDGTPFLNQNQANGTLLGVRQLPSSMQFVLLVMALCWLSWFPFFLFDTDWMGREVYQGDPKGDIVKATSYQRGVQEGAFGLLLNSVILGISSLFIDPLCRLLGSKNVWALGNFIVFVAMAFTGIITMNVVHSRADGSYHHPNWVRIAAVILFTVLGFPLAITYSVPYSLTADLTADAGAGQGLAMGILNLAVVIPQTLVALGSGPWDALFGGGNEPAFGLASISALAAGIIAFRKLPMLSRNGYHRTTMMHGPH